MVYPLKKHPSTVVQNNFGSCLKWVSSHAKPIIIEKKGKPTAVLISFDKWQEMQNERPSYQWKWLEDCDRLVAGLKKSKKQQSSAVELVRELRNES